MESRGNDSRQLMAPLDALAQTLALIQQRLRYMQRLGCRGFDIAPATVQQIGIWQAPPPPPRPSVQTSASAAPTTTAETLDDIRADLGDCARCRLGQNRRQIVFGAGSPQARIVFVGEAPGDDEDRMGQPFVGPAGQLLTKIIQAIGFTREQVYICNIIKCHPPGNRNPKPDEIACCRPFLDRQLACIQPEFICALGKFAAQTLLDTQTAISALRGRIFPYGDSRLMPTFHPAYLLRSPQQKRPVWDDMKKMLHAMGLAPPVQR